MTIRNESLRFSCESHTESIHAFNGGRPFLHSGMRVETVCFCWRSPACQDGVCFRHRLIPWKERGLLASDDMAKPVERELRIGGHAREVLAIPCFFRHCLSLSIYQKLSSVCKRGMNFYNLLFFHLIYLHCVRINIIFTPKFILWKSQTIGQRIRCFLLLISKSKQNYDCFRHRESV